MHPVSVIFHGDLLTLLPKHQQGESLADSRFRRASVKDVIEACGIPHTEVGSIRLDGNFVDFLAMFQPGQKMEVFPVDRPWHVRQPSLLRPVPLPRIAFLVDENVHRLAGLLRMIGIDAADCRGMRDADIARESERQGRILLSRDHRLLQRKRVVFGRLVRSNAPWEQLQEIVQLFALQALIRPFSRCIHCNVGLKQRSKAEVEHRLEPLTRRYYHSFFECPACCRLYWSGSHHQRMRERLAQYDLTF